MSKDKVRREKRKPKQSKKPKPAAKTAALGAQPPIRVNPPSA